MIQGMKNLSTLSLLLALVLFSGCTEERGQPDCPYQPIEWGQQHKQVIDKKQMQGELDLSGKLDAYFNKLGKGSISPRVKTELNKITEEILNSNIEYDKTFVANWNALVADICGKIAILDRNIINDSLIRLEIEKDIVDKAKKFYELATGYNEKQKTQRSPGTKFIPKTEEIKPADSLEVLLTHGYELDGGLVTADGQVLGTASGTSFLTKLPKRPEPYIFAIRTEELECTEIAKLISNRMRIPISNCKTLNK